ncbi:vesicular stomatitis virus matrix protein [Psittacid alphaherpesvirus 5]|nr:vesicular stomatitis virus matrix protein [Psittacid alphaherpesvirus 5]
MSPSPRALYTPAVPICVYADVNVLRAAPAPLFNVTHVLHPSSTVSCYVPHSLRVSRSLRRSP